MPTTAKKTRVPPIAHLALLCIRLAPLRYCFLGLGCTLVDRLGCAQLPVGFHQGFRGECVRATQPGEESRGRHRDDDRADASEDDRAHGSPPVGGEAAFELAA